MFKSESVVFFFFSYHGESKKVESRFVITLGILNVNIA